MSGNTNADRSSVKNYNLPFLSGLIRGHGEKNNRLNKEEEIKLWQVIKNNLHQQDVQTAKEKIILAQYPLLTYLAKKKTRDRNIIDDLIALGIEVCLNRLAFFQPDRGCRFSTYVCIFIKKAMDIYYKKIKSIGITYYPVTGFTMLEFDETFYDEKVITSETSETDRIVLLNKLDNLDWDERELIERHYFKEERLIDIARQKLQEEFKKNPDSFITELAQNYPQHNSEERWEKIIKKEHDRIRQRLHRAELKLGKMINKEENSWTASHRPQPIK